MAGRLLNKVAVVTGSSSGLGRAISLLYAKEGASVICSDLKPSANSLVPSESDFSTHELIQKTGGKSIFVKADVSKAADMSDLIANAVKAFGRLDIMVNNAGVALEARDPQPIHLTSESTWDITLAVNAKSVFLGCKYATAQMLKQPPHESGDRGWIVNMSSIKGLVGGPENSSYCASKGAVTSLTRQVAWDYAKHRIHVNAICPGCISSFFSPSTAIFEETTTHMTPLEVLEERHPFGGPGVPSDIAKMAVVLASDDASWVTGINLPVDGGYTAR
ncbi:putative oxidoreductase [Lachnellula subtilissima]|uniref:Putative oxidoreductase n=1 Tax=Lachnellula subtilissima TaxID=602034 RepID=A0A8H8UB50_9HELO|nr:putative oxidoreductase [Lachnellula subtilissima]